jgi:ferredoxin-NADP reductase
LARELYTARLISKECISEVTQCFHFHFEIEGLETFSFTPGQFISAVTTDQHGKEQTRAYSFASAPSGNGFDLCVNRVEGGFFSNHLPDLPVGATIQVYGPNGYFTLRQPITDSIFVATGTGIAPMRSFAQWLFPPESGPDAGTDRSNGKQIWLIFGTRHETEIYYQQEFEALAARKPNFHFLCTLSRGLESWSGLRGYVQEHMARIVEDRAERLGHTLPMPPIDPATPAANLKFDIYTYICGLNNMVSGVREKLASFGWHKKQIIFERYD